METKELVARVAQLQQEISEVRVVAARAEARAATISAISHAYLVMAKAVIATHPRPALLRDAFDMLAKDADAQMLASGIDAQPDWDAAVSLLRADMERAVSG